MSEPEFAQRLFENLDTLEHRYRRFTHRQMFANALVLLGVIVYVFIGIPHETEQIQQSRSAALKQVCEDQKTLLKLVPSGYRPLEAARRADPMSSLNPDRDCDEFARRAIAR